MTEKLNLAYRVDAGNIIGTGHLMEIVTIHQALRAAMHISATAYINDSDLAEERLRSVGVDNIIRVSVGDEQREIEALKYLCEDRGHDCIIMDMLNRPPEYYSAVRDIVPRSIVIIDNGDMQEINAELCVNFSILQDPDFYENKNRFDTQYWIGPQHFFFGSGILGLRVAGRPVQETVETIFVNQGGTDPYGLTAKTIRALELLELQSRVVVVVGGGLTEGHYHELEDLKKALRGRYEFYHNIPMEKVHELMSQSGLALTAAGNTLYELALLAVPCVIVSHHQNHDRVARAFDERRAAVNLGIGSDISAEAIARATAEVLADAEARKQLSARISAITEGRGTQSLVSYLSGA